MSGYVSEEDQLRLGEAAFGATGSSRMNPVEDLQKQHNVTAMLERPEFFMFPAGPYNVFVDRWIEELDANIRSKLVKGPFQLYWTESMNPGEEVKSSNAFGRLEGAKAMFVELKATCTFIIVVCTGTCQLFPMIWSNYNR